MFSFIYHLKEDAPRKVSQKSNYATTTISTIVKSLFFFDISLRRSSLACAVCIAYYMQNPSADISNTSQIQAEVQQPHGQLPPLPQQEDQD